MLAVFYIMGIEYMEAPERMAPSCAPYSHADRSRLAAMMARCNRLDITRRSSSYEVHLQKYIVIVGFRVYCEFLDRSKVDNELYKLPLSGLHRKFCT